MASGYVTSDGKDLDSRYLAIGGKAASASYADSAGYANSAGTATNVTNKGGLYRNGNPIYTTVNHQGTYTAPSAGVVAIAASNGSGSLTVGLGIRQNGTLYPAKAVFIQKGDVVSLTNGDYDTPYRIVLYPMRVG